MENTENQSKQRTGQQNRSLHLYCEWLSEELFLVGITQKNFLQVMNEVNNSPESIKSVFREYGRAKYGKKSTADLTTKEVMDIYDEFNRNLAKIGIYIPWPSEEEKNFEETYEKFSKRTT